MTALHHPSDQSLLAYASGALGRTLALVVRAHLEGCEECRNAVNLAETLGGIFLDSEPPAEMSSGAFSKVLAKLETVPDRPQTALPVSWRDAGARRWLVPGIWVRPILKDRAEGSRAYLLGAAAGKALPRHGHNGLEMTQVLEGEFFDGGVRYGPGDFLEAGDEIEHSLLVGRDRACVCISASQGVPKGITGLLMRLIA